MLYRVEKQLRSRVFLKGPVHELINLEYNCFNAAKLNSVVFQRDSLGFMFHNGVHHVPQQRQQA